MKPLIKFNNIHKTKVSIDKLLSDFNGITYIDKKTKISTMTKKILNEIVKRDTKGQALKKLALKLENIFFDEVFENFLSLTNKEQEKFIELLVAYKRRIHKIKIYRNILINYTHKNTKKMLCLLTDKSKPDVLKISYSDFSDIIESNQVAYTYYKNSSLKGFFAFTKQIEPTCEAPLTVSVLKSLLEQSQQIDYLSSENDDLYHFLVNHYNDEDGANYGLHYLKIFDPKSYDQRIVAYIIQCKNNIQHKYRELADELDLLLYRIYEYSLVDDRYSDIADELTMTLTDKIISEAFGNDERSAFWKQYTRSLIEPIIFVKSPATMFMMKFKSIGIVEYIDVGNATYLYEDEDYHRIKNKILSSASNENNVLNIKSYLRQYTLKEITKSGSKKYIHRGSWKNQFKWDMERNYSLYKNGNVY